MMPSKVNTGAGEPYSDTDVAALSAVLVGAFAEYGGGAAPTSIGVRSRLEWAGVEQQSNGGVRSTTLGRVDLAPVQELLDAARRATAKAANTVPATSYRAKGYRAQLSALVSTPRGSALSDRVGLNASTRTVRNWLSETTTPSKANRAKIAEAYAGLSTSSMETAGKSAVAAQRAVADALTRSLSRKYGATIRLRDIERLTLEP